MKDKFKLIVAKCSICLIIVLCGSVSFAQIDVETNFYNVVSHSNFNKNLVDDYGVDNDFTTDDSGDLQVAINDISNNGGGVLTIPAGNYSFAAIDLKSNVHLDIDNDVVIRPSLRSDQKNYNIFGLGESSNPIMNTSISSSSGGRFKVDLTQNNNPNVAVVNLGKVSNFLIANFNVDDVYTKFSVITFGGDYFNSVYTIPTNGIIKDIDVNEAHYGYGTVQIQSGENILFKDLSGTGGATLRMETGFTGLNNLQGTNLPTGVTRVGGVNSLVARNISSTDGNCAVMVSPHAMHNGTVDVEGVVSVNSGFAARVEGGFVSKKYDQTIGLVDGTFESVRIKDVTATFGNTAELKSKHFKHFPDEIDDPTQLSTYSTKIHIGPSIAPVLADTNYNCTGTTQTVVIEAPIIGNGFLHQENVIPEEFVTLNCSVLSTGENQLIEDVLLFPNPVKKAFNAKSTNEASLCIYDVSGIKVKSNIILQPAQLYKIDVTMLSSGVYFVKILKGNNLINRKIIIE